MFIPRPSFLLSTSRSIAQRVQHQTLSFSSSAFLRDRAVVYSQNGNPSDVLTVLTYPDIRPPPPNSVNIRFLLSPINPADINVIEGVYPSKPTITDALAASGKGSKSDPVFIGGNEGVARVTALGSGVSTLKVDDWVVMTKPQSGTWSTNKNVSVEDVAKVPDAHLLSEAQCATMSVNPPTAYLMLSEFVHLSKGDFVIQNGANSAVGQAVIQIASAWGLNTINLVRNRENLDKLKDHLYSLGAWEVLTYDELSDKETRKQLMSRIGRANIRLGLNGVGGKETTMMAKLLGKDSHLVSYGAMSKQPLSLPTSLFIFKNLTAHGFWQTCWYSSKSAAERENMIKSIAQLMADEKLKAPEHEILTIEATDTDEVATEKVRSMITKLSEGRYGKKILLKLEH